MISLILPAIMLKMHLLKSYGSTNKNLLFVFPANAESPKRIFAA